MMHVLIESGARPRKRSGRWTFASIAAHAAIVSLAIVATSEATTPAAPLRVPPDTIIYVVPEPPATRTLTKELPQSGARISVPDRPRIALPTDVSLPNVPTFDARRPFANDLGLLISGAGLDTDGALRVSGTLNGLHTANSVDRAVLAYASNPRPDYPQSLRAAGLEGDVLVTFVVDSSGRVEPGSVKIVQSTHDQFADAVRRWLPKTRYRPAEAGGVRVRQYVQQQVGFALARDR